MMLLLPSEPTKVTLLASVPTICDIMDNFPDREVIQMEACGAMWNYSNDWFSRFNKHSLAISDNFSKI